MASGLSAREAGSLDARVLGALHRECFGAPGTRPPWRSSASAPGTLCLIGSVGDGASTVVGGL